MNANKKISRRELLKGAVALGVGAGLGGCATGSQVTKHTERQGHRKIIERENARSGTTEWLLTNTRIDPKSKYRCPWIEGFCSHTSIRGGEDLRIFVSTNPPSSFHIELYRMGYYGGAGGRFMRTLGPFKGTRQDDPPLGKRRVRECKWEASATIRIPRDWVSGVYLGKLIAERENLQSYIIFIVRDDRPADFIFQ